MEKRILYSDMKGKTGFEIDYEPSSDGSARVRAITEGGATSAETSFGSGSIDEAHILYMEATELLRSRAALGEKSEAIGKRIEKLFALFRGEKVSFAEEYSDIAPRKPSGEFKANPGKKIEIDVRGAVYERLPVRTRIITLADTDIVPIVEEYVKPYLEPGDSLFVSEKALTITQGRVVDMGTIRPTRFARILARNVGNNYGSSDFRGFGHGTAIAMQALVDEAGILRSIFAAATAAITRPFGIKGMFYRICGKQAKSIDCPMSFLILEYAHSVKLAPSDPDGAARRIKEALGCETVILDANYRGAFSLGKTTGKIYEDFVSELFRDNPLGQSDEMTPFCIVRKKAALDVREPQGAQSA